ncbi:reverse transcriptase domain-containing protein [Tanacetum coccineum]
MSVRLPDRSFQYPVGIAKNMLIEVGKITFPADFVILEMEEDSKVPLILGRPFLHTADAVIRVKQKHLNLRVGTEQMIFNIDSAMKHSYSNDDTCFSIDVVGNKKSIGHFQVDIIAEFCNPSRWKELSKETSSKILPCGGGSCWKTFKPIARLITEVRGMSIRFVPTGLCRIEEAPRCSLRELDGILVALVARFGVISKNTDMIRVSHGG